MSMEFNNLIEATGTPESRRIERQMSDHITTIIVNFRDWILGTGKFSEESLKKARDEFFTKLGKHWSEPMLASVEKAFSDHDAVPEARASLPTADHAVRRGCESGCGTGNTLTLTDEEREAVDRVVAFLFGLSDTEVQAGTCQVLRQHAKTLRTLLERLK